MFERKRHVYIYIPSNGLTAGIQGFLAIDWFWAPQPRKSIWIKNIYKKPGFPYMTPLSPFAAQAQSASRAILAMTRKGRLHLDLVRCWV